MAPASGDPCQTTDSPGSRRLRSNSVRSRGCSWVTWRVYPPSASQHEKNAAEISRRRVATLSDVRHLLARAIRRLGPGCLVGRLRRRHWLRVEAVRHRGSVSTARVTANGREYTSRERANYPDGNQQACQVMTKRRLNCGLILSHVTALSCTGIDLIRSKAVRAGGIAVPKLSFRVAHCQHTFVAPQCRDCHSVRPHIVQHQDSRCCSRLKSVSNVSLSLRISVELLAFHRPVTPLANRNIILYKDYTL